MISSPESPVAKLPDENWEHYSVWAATRTFLEKLSRHFKSTISVTGISATEVYSFGSVLGLTIEEEVVRTLNNLKHEWDTNNTYTNYSFIRQPETFPDVLLKETDGNQVIMGIELKSWYLLAKEGEPSFRFTVNPSVCNIQDLMVVVPWTLSNVLSGSPIVYAPYIAMARYVAEYRNYWWQYIRSARSSADIKSPEEAAPYPYGREKISDHPVSDSGKNFGRIARIGIMDNYVKQFENLKLLGKYIHQWRDFFKSD